MRDTVVLLSAEAKLGEVFFQKYLKTLQDPAKFLEELLKANPPGFRRKNSGQIEQQPLPSGITKKQSHYAQELARHPEAIARNAEKQLKIISNKQIDGWYWRKP